MSSDSADVRYYNEAKQLSASARTETDFYKVLSLLEKAHRINAIPKYQKRIEQMKMVINDMKKLESSRETSSDRSKSRDSSAFEKSNSSSQNIASSVPAKFDNEANHLAEAIASVNIAGDSAAGDRFVEVQGVKIKRKIYDKLYAYQVDGLNWLLSLYKEHDRVRGGVLADDMGLGKTIQSIVFISSLMENKLIRSALVVAPGTLLTNWAKEFKAWYPSVDLYHYHDATPKQRLLQLAACQRSGGVLFTTYGLLNNHVDEYLCQHRGNHFTWDVCVLDEAHNIKNPNKTSSAANRIAAKFRLAVSGTPLQNRLSELWAIYNWIFQGTLLGGYQNFKITYELPITNARGKNASVGLKERGTRLAESLRKIYMPYFLRRTKDEVLSVAGKLSRKLPPKTDLIVWITLSKNQISIYEDILKSKETKAAFREKQRALVMLNNLKKLCDSLLLLPASTVDRLHRRHRQQHKQNKENDDANVLDELFNEDKEMVDVSSLDADFILENTSKLKFLIQLIQLHREEGHRTLVFSYSVRMLDIIQRVLQLEGHKMARIDGSVKTRDRDVIIETFRQKSDVSVFLLTTGVGGVGLTLTEADRVVIYDPSWNPAVDAQAIDRAYRIGQTKPVTVYRLITVSTVEEKIFRRQVFKNSVIKQMVNSERDPMRYFTDNDIRELFKFGDPHQCETFLHLLQVHGDHIANMENEDLQKLLSLDSCYNATDHNLLFTEEDKDEYRHGEHGDSDNIDQVVASAERNLHTDAKAHGAHRATNWNPLDIATIPGRKASKPVKSFPRLANPTDTRGIEVVEIDETSVLRSVTSSNADESVELVDVEEPARRSSTRQREAQVVQLDDDEENKENEEGEEDEEQQEEEPRPVKIDEVSVYQPANSTHLNGFSRFDKFETTISSIESLESDSEDHHSSKKHSSTDIDPSVKLTAEENHSSDSSTDAPVDLSESLKPTYRYNAIDPSTESSMSSEKTDSSIRSVDQEDSSCLHDKSHASAMKQLEGSTHISSTNDRTKFLDETLASSFAASALNAPDPSSASSDEQEDTIPAADDSDTTNNAPSHDMSGDSSYGEQNTLFNLLRKTDTKSSSSDSTDRTEYSNLSSESSLN